MPEVGSLGSEVRSQKPEVRSQKSEVGSQKAEVVRPRDDGRPLPPSSKLWRTGRSDDGRKDAGQGLIPYGPSSEPALLFLLANLTFSITLVNKD
jgi:hypothetical protein